MKLHDFIHGKVAYVVDFDTLPILMQYLEENSDIRWFSGNLPTEYNPYNIWCEPDDFVTIGVCRLSNLKYGLGHAERHYFENHDYKVEVFEYDKLK